MSTDVKVPPFPESVEEGTLTAWYKQAGDAVERDEKVADIETDKIVLEVSAPAEGVLADRQVSEGDTVKPGQVLAQVEEGEAPATKETEEERPAADEAEADSATAESSDEPEIQDKAGSEASGETPASKSKKGGKKGQADTKDEAAEAPQGDAEDIPLSPAVRRLVNEHDLDATKIPGSGRRGMITKADVLKYLERPEQEEDDEKEADSPAGASESVKTAPSGDTETPSPSVTTGQDGRPEKRAPMSRIRARIAERLVEAQQTAAILTTFNEVNMKPVMDRRAQHKEAFAKAHDVKLGVMSFFVKASVYALKKFPIVNASLDGTDIIYHGYYDIGVAVSTDRGLVVPVMRDADALSYADIEKGINGFAARAREGKLSMEDLTGGTFSITNGGVFGSLLSTPILNPPQCAILGMHKIQERPMVENGEVVVRPVMYLALSYDHRIIDGREAVQFLVAVKEYLEDPSREMLAL